jgi:MFS family permease
MLSSFIVNLGWGAILPFMAIYADLFFFDFDWGFMVINVTTQIGLLTSAMMISRAFLAPVYGKMSDVAGRKPVIVVGLAMYVFLTFGFGLAQAFWSLFLVRFFQGVASALVWPVAESAIVDISKEDKRGRNLGWFILSQTLGWAIGPFLGSGLFSLSKLMVATDVSAFRITFFMLGGLSFLAFLAFNFMVIDPKTSKARMSLKELWFALKEVLKTTGKIRLGIPAFLKPSFWKERNSSLKAVYVLSFTNGFNFAMIFPILSLFLEDGYLLTPEFIGIVFGISGIAGVTFNPLGGYLADKTSKKGIVVISGILSAMLLFFLGFEMVIYGLIALFVIRQLVQQINMPAFRALQADLVEEKIRGLEFGNVQMFNNLGAVLGPIVGGILYGEFRWVKWSIGSVNIFGIEILMAITTLIMILSSIMIFLFVKKKDMIIITRPKEIEHLPTIIEAD